MTHVHIAAGVAFGIHDRLPSLPEGYKWLQSANDWLQVRDPQGRMWFADFRVGRYSVLLRLRRIAGFWDFVRTFGRIRPGDAFMDERFTMVIPVGR